MPTSLSAPVAMVTGGGRGIGRAIVDRLHADGLRVMTCGRGERPVDLPKPISWTSLDVADPRAATHLVERTAATLGDIAVLVNNAGVQVEKPLDLSTDDDWDLVVGTNCRGVFNTCRAALPQLQRTGGVIVNIGSISASHADASMALYNASKAFVDALTRSIAVDHGPAVRAVAIHPGWILTEMASSAFALADDPDRAQQDAVARHPVGRLGQPRDIANAVAWLISEQASFISGQSLTVDGGLTAASPLRPDLH